ncbi:MAG: nitrile hydratase subunit beta [Gammaproteobacteria bacterium]
MDGIHDLGGKQGYGPIEVDDEGGPFHEDWEGREWGIAQCARTPGITIDWWRHCRELIMPVDYLGRPYFDSWAQTDFSTYIEAGWMTLEEIAALKSLEANREHGEPPAAMTLQQVLQEDHDHAFRFDGEIEAAPVFSVGQRVVTAKHGHAGHTRLPQYARGRNGTIQAYNGAHVFPDLSARGTEVHQHCYNVMFDASELWPEASGSKDKVCLDLWESYLRGA